MKIYIYPILFSKIELIRPKNVLKIITYFGSAPSVYIYAYIYILMVRKNL